MQCLANFLIGAALRDQAEDHELSGGKRALRPPSVSVDVERSATTSR